MRQCEIWKANLDPTVGSEQAGFRPVVIISGNVMNKYLDDVIVCPLTTKLKNFKGDVILRPKQSNGLKKPSEILTIHVRYLSKKNLFKKIGSITPEELALTKKGLNEILTF